MANTARTRELERAWAERPELDPTNFDDAWFIAARPEDFDPALLVEANRTLDNEGEGE